MITVDAASDEVLASEMMRITTRGALESLTPNLRVVLRDKAHSSRRNAMCIFFMCIYIHTYLCTHY